jgi:hypothetical protein
MMGFRAELALLPPQPGALETGAFRYATCPEAGRKAVKACRFSGAMTGFHPEAG